MPVQPLATQAGLEAAMKWGRWLLVFATASCTLPHAAAADDTAAKAALTRQLEHQLPGNWQMHVRWREGTLLASFMPPYQEAFDLWYQPDVLLDRMKGLCPVAGDPIWHMLTPAQDIVMEPTVGGKTAEGMRVSCRNAVRKPS
ncbi:MAG TPA: hypothetical protein VKF40_11900 [Burkholderiales bacterium]|nr:hypothetical protein [Burkholderiales bacterium]